MNRNDFVVFILTHGRPDNVITLDTLKKTGYTGPIIYVVDNEDQTTGRYIENFGRENVYIFDKKAEADKIDEGNNFDNRSVIVHARNVCFSIAEEKGYKYFIELDDDYTSFDFRIDDTSNGKTGIIKPVKNLDTILNLFLNYYESAPFASIAFAQGGDFIGGINNGKGSYRFNKRKCMNSFICSVDRRFEFVGSINEDVNTYTSKASRGLLFFTIPFISLTQKQTQSQKGGMTGAYLSQGTYVKSFTSVLMQPSSVKVSMMNSKNPRLHHSVNWVNTVPLIMNEKYKK